ncbi:hypothetical protein, partial [Richelia intracellularis]|uniref:hypothetical protein n=1 Tax=Richelia intracellularis TaxID=1164990 RepID=UPI0005C5790D
KLRSKSKAVLDKIYVLCLYKKGYKHIALSIIYQDYNKDFGESLQLPVIQLIILELKQIQNIGPIVFRTAHGFRNLNMNNNRKSEIL